MALLGIALGSWSAARIRRSNIDEAVRLIGFAKATTLYTLTHLSSTDLPQNPAVQAELGRLIMDGSMQSKRLVGLVVWQRSGRQLVYASEPLSETAAAIPSDAGTAAVTERDWQRRRLPEHLRPVAFPPARH